MKVCRADGKGEGGDSTQGGALRRGEGVWRARIAGRAVLCTEARLSTRVDIGGMLVVTLVRRGIWGSVGHQGDRSDELC